MKLRPVTQAILKNPVGRTRMKDNDVTVINGEKTVMVGIICQLSSFRCDWVPYSTHHCPISEKIRELAKEFCIWRKFWRMHPPVEEYAWMVLKLIW